VPVPARPPIPLSIRTCGFPAYGLAMIFLTWLRCLRVADGAAEPVRAVLVEPLFRPRPGPPGSQVPARFLIIRLGEPVYHVAVGLADFGGGVPGPCACSLQSGFRRPAQPAASQRRTGACYWALRCLRGRDFHPQAWIAFRTPYGGNATAAEDRYRMNAIHHRQQEQSLATASGDGREGVKIPDRCG
jgi:hypothetical protein